MKMRTEKPVIQRTYITATDAITKKSESLTVYGTTPQAIIEAIEKMIAKGVKADSPSAA